MSRLFYIEVCTQSICWAREKIWYAGRHHDVLGDPDTVGAPLSCRLCCSFTADQLDLARLCTNSVPPATVVFTHKKLAKQHQVAFSSWEASSSGAPCWRCGRGRRRYSQRLVWGSPNILNLLPADIFISAWSGLLAAVKDPKTFLFSFIAFFDLMGMGFANFFPT